MLLLRFRVHVHLILGYLVAAVTLAAVALLLRGPGLLLLWPALTFAALSIAYATGSARWLGKRGDGSIHPLAQLVFLPYLLWVRLALRLRQSGFAGGAWNQVGAGLIVGRRPLAGPLPDGVDLVVDCTAEHVEPRWVVESYPYRTLPTLDRWIADDESFTRLVRDLIAHPGTIYLHCAAGKGRSAAVATALLIARGQADTVAEAEAQIQASRPQVRLHRAQRLQVERVVSRLATRLDT